MPIFCFIFTTIAEHAINIYFFFLYKEELNFSYYLCVLFDTLPEFLLTLFIIYNLFNFSNNFSESLFQVHLCFLIYSIVLLSLLIEIPFYFCLQTNVMFGYCWINSIYIIISKIAILSLILVFLLISRKKIKAVIKLNLAWELPLVLSYSILFMFFLTSSYDLFGVYLSIEGLSLTLYVLSALVSKSITSIEATVKYFSLGAISTGILLLGISIIYGLVGCLDFITIQLYLGDVRSYYHFLELKFGLVLILISFFFKISVFPCHVWIADVYEGVWTPITFFMSVVIKLTLILFFIRFFFSVLFNVIFCFQFLLCFVSLGSLLIGALGALKQTRIKRFIAYTSINQVGFIMLGVSSCNNTGLASVIVYLTAYIFMSIIFFIIVLNTEHIVTQKSLVHISDLYLYSQSNNRNSKYLLLTLMSMSGIPPLGGFVGKLYVYLSIVEARLDYIFLASLLISILSTYYYLSLVRHILFEKCFNLKLYYLSNKSSLSGTLKTSALMLTIYPLFIGLKISTLFWLLKNL